MIPVKIKRAQIGVGRGVDVTVKSATGRATVFAPSWELVVRHKADAISDEEYTKQYLQILDKVLEGDWVWLHDQAVRGLVVILCYCKITNTFCHTHLLIDYAIQHYPHLFARQVGSNPVYTMVSAVPSED